MRIDISELDRQYSKLHAARRSPHGVEQRLRPRVTQYDFLALSTLLTDIRELLAQIQISHQGVAVDIGCDKSPYREVLEARGFTVKTLDITPDGGADYIGTAESTGLPDSSVDLVLCTQVLEHCDDPWLATREFERILKPGGHLLFTVPHVWFYHPHPKDNWRFTQQGTLKLCQQAALQPIALMAQGGTILAVAQVVNFAMYGVLGRKGALVYAIVNYIASRLDRWLPNELFSLNFACLSYKPAREVGAS